MDEFGPEFERDLAGGIVLGEDAPAEAVAGFQQSDVDTPLSQRGGGSKPRCARADDENVSHAEIRCSILDRAAGACSRIGPPFPCPFSSPPGDCDEEGFPFARSGFAFPFDGVAEWRGDGAGAWRTHAAAERPTAL